MQWIRSYRTIARHRDSARDDHLGIFDDGPGQLSRREGAVSLIRAIRKSFAGGTEPRTLPGCDQL